MYIYCLINGNGDVVRTSHDGEELEYLRESIESNSYNASADELGRDIDDLSERESAEVAFKAGYDDGCPYIAKFEKSVIDSEDEVETENGDILSTLDILEALID